MDGIVRTVELAGVKKIRSGKVREVFDLGSHYLIVATDRLSAFDCIFPGGIPHKGRVLTLLSAWWFERLRDIVPNHMISVATDDFPSELKPYRTQLDGRAMLVKKARVFPIECIARGYLIGSGWREYCERGLVCGAMLRPGYAMADRLDQPIFTPATKADSGHDENISFDVMASRIGHDHAQSLKKITLELYAEAARHARQRGILLADTKFEFGLDEEGRIMLVDEALTPDSSRYWPAAGYVPGRSPPSFDKQIVRDYLETTGWNKLPPAPALPPDIIEKTSQKYLEAYERITGSVLPV